MSRLGPFGRFQAREMLEAVTPTTLSWLGGRGGLSAIASRARPAALVIRSLDQSRSTRSGCAGHGRTCVDDEALSDVPWGLRSRPAADETSDMLSNAKVKASISMLDRRVHVVAAYHKGTPPFPGRLARLYTISPR